MDKHHEGKLTSRTDIQQFTHHIYQDIKALDDIRKLPFTTKEDLRKNYPFGLFTVPMDDVVRVHASSGTTGKPTVVGYTKEDIKLWAGLMAR